MFVLNQKYYAVKTWFHDLPNNLTQPTLYCYDTAEDLQANQNEISSEIFKFEYAPELHSLVGIEAAVQYAMESIEPI